MSNELFKEWYSRGYLPHYDHYGLMQSITFRLNDSLPRERVLELKTELEQVPIAQQDVVRRQRIDEWLDAGYGCCALKDIDMARVMQESLLRFDGSKYRLIAWCIMPNHVHVLIEPLISLSKIVQSWKAYTGKWAIKKGFSGCAEDSSAFKKENSGGLLRVPRVVKELRSADSTLNNKFWMSGYWDRYIRDEKHFQAVVEYIHNNPLKAKLCRNASDWQWSSAKGFVKD